MSEICKECGADKSELTPKEVGKLLKDHKSMWIWEEYKVGTEVEVPGLGTVEIVYNTYLTTADNADIKMVWKTRCGYVGLTGYYSSYGGSDWSDQFLPAEPKTKEVVYFE